MNRGGIMALNIGARWLRPLELRRSNNRQFIYECPEIENVPESPGVYLFGRQHGDSAVPLYVGRTMNLKVRLGQHLNSVRLMGGLLDAANGQRFFMACVVQLKRGQRMEKVLRVLEDGLIAHALAEGHELLQRQGTKRPAHQVNFTGNRTSECIAPRDMMIRATS